MVGRDHGDYQAVMPMRRAFQSCIVPIPSMVYLKSVRRHLATLVVTPQYPRCITKNCRVTKTKAARVRKRSDRTAAAQLGLVTRAT
jgi:hypothetical protein